MKLTCLRLLNISVALFFFSFCATAQDSLSGTYVDISKVPLAKSISKYVYSDHIGRHDVLKDVYSGRQFKPGIGEHRAVPNQFVTKKWLLKFNLCNTADTMVSVFFFPGFYYNSIHLYREQGNTLKQLPDILAPTRDSTGYRLVTLAAHDSATFIAELSFVKTYINTIRPRLVNPAYLDGFMAELRSSNDDSDLMTYIFCGFLLMMILYSISSFFQGANPEFLYYSGYAFFLGLMLFTKAALNYHTNQLSFFVEAYLDFVMQSLGIMFYMIFMQRFLDTRNRYVFLNRLYNAGIVMLVISILAYSFFHYFTDNYTVEYDIEFVTKILLMLMMLIFLVYSLRHREDRLLRYLFWGNLFLFVFSILSQTFTLIRPNFKGVPDIFNSSLFYYEIGLLLELVFFLAGLNHKNRKKIIEQTKERERLKADNQMKEYEKEIAVYKAQQNERERISADMHDELGSGMTAIRLMSEIARNKMKENTPVEIERISHSANDVLNKMNAIIWSMNSGNDSLDNLISYIRSYSLEYFENTPIQCKVNTPDQIPEKELTGDKRRNIFLCVKETLNNALKHSKASLITIDIECSSLLWIRISDNGVGIDMQNLRQFGNGLKNIGRRMHGIGGTFSIENNNGTVTVLELPL